MPRAGGQWAGGPVAGRHDGRLASDKRNAVGGRRSGARAGARAVGGRRAGWPTCGQVGGWRRSGGEAAGRRAAVRRPGEGGGRRANTASGSPMKQCPLKKQLWKGLGSRELCLLQGRTARTLQSRRPALAPCRGDGVANLTEAITERRAVWGSKNGPTCSGESSYSPHADVSAGPAWSFRDETSSIVHAHSVIDEHHAVYLSHKNGRLRKFSSAGELLWTNEDNFQGPDALTAQVVPGGPLLLGGAVFVGSALCLSQGRRLCCVCIGWGMTGHCVALAAFQDQCRSACPSESHFIVCGPNLAEIG